MSLEMVFTQVIALVLLIVGIILWPKWMTLTRDVLSNKVYFLLSRYMKYSEIRALFSGLFYFLYALTLMVLMVILVPDVSYFHLLQLRKWYDHPLEFFFETITIFFAGMSLIFIISNVIFTLNPKLRVTPRSYEDSWMEIYLKVPSFKVLMISAFFPVISEELLFRWITTLILRDACQSLNWNVCSANNDILEMVMVVALVSTILFCIQQAAFLRTREQFLMVLTGAFSIGFTNSVALLLGSSVISLIIVHYLYLLFFIFQQIFMKNQYKIGMTIGSS